MRILLRKAKIITISYGTVNKGKAEIYTFVWKCEHRIAVVDDKPLLQDVH
jgi:hypothetical protein